MTRLFALLPLFAILGAVPAQAGSKETPQSRAEDAALRAEYKAANGIVVITLDKKARRMAVHDALVRHYIGHGNVIVVDLPYQVVARTRSSQQPGGARAQAVALANAPAAPVVTRTASIIEDWGKPLRVRFCERVGQENLYTSTRESDCVIANFNQWREAHAAALAALAPEALGIVKAGGAGSGSVDFAGQAASAR